MRYFLRLAYRGTNYVGWQIQPNGETVQGTIEKALQTYLRMEVKTMGCGRTDTGVHASEFYLHFDFESLEDPAQLVYKLNHLLPEDIAIFNCIPVGDDDHARFGASQRTYHYFLHRRKDPFLKGQSTYTIYDFDLDLMNQEAEWLKSVKDFGAFCKAGGSQHTTICDLTECVWKQENHRFIFTVSADRFLRNMVRSMVGTFIDLGRGKITSEEFRAIVNSGERKNAGTSVSPDGLFLARVKYPFL
ncbi:MAG: tRNA pseudouridine(38-40) synthase TruA [Flavobacteriales bacterium]|nr:tRNA pseudouridine(38-40) synthase TruA [Flavobacteriales bacterium]